MTDLLRTGATGLAAGFLVWHLTHNSGAALWAGIFMWNLAALWVYQGEDE